MGVDSNRTAVVRLRDEDERGWVSGSDMTTGDDRSGEGLAIGQPRTRKRSARLMVEVMAPND